VAEEAQEEDKDVQRAGPREAGSKLEERAEQKPAVEVKHKTDEGGNENETGKGRDIVAAANKAGRGQVAKRAPEEAGQQLRRKVLRTSYAGMDTGTRAYSW
jgi:hypothetical protein